MLSVTTTSGYVTFFDYVNFTGTVLAVVANMIAGYTGPTAEKARFYTTAFLAALYACAYGTLLWTPVSVQEWSNAVRGFGWLSWYVVWIWPALSQRRFTKVVNRHLTHREGYEDE